MFWPTRTGIEVALVDFINAKMLFEMAGTNNLKPQTSVIIVLTSIELIPNVQLLSTIKSLGSR